MFEELRFWWTDGRRYRRRIRELELRAASMAPPMGSSNIMRACDSRADLLKKACFHREPWSVGGGRDELMDLPLRIRQHDTDYDVRYGLVLEAMALAHRVGFKAGFRFDPADPEWPVAYIELPTGQVSWHLPQHPVVWDRHTTEEKYRRIERFACYE